jgi:glutathione synthase/RimK-type ligase-like ATP-grasp enzyme
MSHASAGRAPPARREARKRRRAREIRAAGALGSTRTEAALPTIAFLTSRELAGLTDDDRLAVSALEARGARVEPVVWTDDRSLDAFDLVVIRSPWDWQEQPRRFAELLSATPRIENRSAARWLDKRYLLDLEARGVRIVPTTVLASPDDVARCEHEDAVLKPALGAGGHRTFRFGRGEAARIAELARSATVEGAWILQPYVEEVATEGEWSLLFFDGVYSHALKKRAARGEFRVHAEWGGSVEPATPPAAVLEDARRALDAAGERFLYARVDGIVSTRLGGFCLTELEVVEPELFFRMDEGAAVRFAEAVGRRVELPPRTCSPRRRGERGDAGGEAARVRAPSRPSLRSGEGVGKSAVVRWRCMRALRPASSAVGGRISGRYDGPWRSSSRSTASGASSRTRPRTGAF